MEMRVRILVKQVTIVPATPMMTMKTMTMISIGENDAGGVIKMVRVQLTGTY
jgi:hypothetical protein